MQDSVHSLDKYRADLCKGLEPYRKWVLVSTRFLESTSWNSRRMTKNN